MAEVNLEAVRQAIEEIRAKWPTVLVNWSQVEHFKQAGMPAHIKGSDLIPAGEAYVLSPIMQRWIDEVPQQAN